MNLIPPDSAADSAALKAPIDNCRLKNIWYNSPAEIGEVA